MARPVDPRLRDRVLQAATGVFAERGFGRASMSEIGRRAGVTKGGVYFHFRSKEGLFFAVFDARRDSLNTLLAPKSSGRGGAALADAARALRALFATYLAFHFRDPEAARLARVLDAELRDAFTAKLREDAALEQRMLRARIRDLLARGNRDGTLFAPDPAFSAFVLASALRGAIDQWLTAPADAEPFCRIDSLADELALRYATSLSPQRPDASRVVEVDDANVEFRPPPIV